MISQSMTVPKKSPSNARSVLWVAFGMMSLVFAGCSPVENEIIRISRQNNSGTFAYFREAVAGAGRELKLGSIDLSGSKDVVEMVATTPNAIGYSGMGYANARVKMLGLKRAAGRAISPTSDAVLDGGYPLARKLYIYVVGEPHGAVKHFLEWILSQPGQVLVRELGYVPVPNNPPFGLLTSVTESGPKAGPIKIAGSDTMVNLAQAWAERYSQEFPQVRPEVSGGGTGVGIAKLIDGTIEMANASREMKPEEKQQIETKFAAPVREFVVALDALAVYVHASNPLNEISLEDLAEIYGEGGQITNWTQVSGWPHGDSDK